MYKEMISELAKENKWVKIQPPCSENDIDKAEKAIGYTFPKELRALLLEMNGDNFLIMSVEEIVEQSRMNKEVQEEYSDEEFAKELDKYIFLPQTAAGIITAIMRMLMALLMKALSLSGNTKSPVVSG